MYPSSCESLQHFQPGDSTYNYSIFSHSNVLLDNNQPFGWEKKEVFTVNYAKKDTMFMFIVCVNIVVASYVYSLCTSQVFDAF